jgi:hypothetical protein
MRSKVLEIVPLVLVLVYVLKENSESVASLGE